MAVNKVVINQNGVENVLVDITDSTVTPETLAEGETAYGANGEKIMGVMKAGSDPVQSDWNQTDDTAPDYIKNKPFGTVPGSNTLNAPSDILTRPMYNSYDNFFYKVSDIVLTMEDFADRMYYIKAQDNGTEITCEGYSGMVVGKADGSIDILYIRDNGDLFGAVQSYPEGSSHPAGTYFLVNEGDSGTGEFKVLSIEIQGFNEFPIFKTIPKEYLPDDIGGASSWNDLTDKPFGVIGKGDTLTWDCKENNPYTNDITYWWTRLYKVSDAIITEEDLQNGAITTFDDVFGQYQMTSSFENGLIWHNDDGAIFIGAGDPDAGMPTGAACCYPENSTYPPGIYFTAWFNDATYYVKDLTIPGYGKFPVVKPIENEYLPNALKIGEVSGVGDTLVWDGNVAGLIPWKDDVYPVSHAAVPIEFFENGVTIEYYPYANDPDPANRYYLNVSDPDSGLHRVEIRYGNLAILWVYDDNGNEHDLAYFYSDGDVLLSNGSMSGMRIRSVTIPGFTGFTEPVIKPIDKKYLPKAAAVKDSENATVTADEFNALLNTLRNAGYLAT